MVRVGCGRVRAPMARSRVNRRKVQSRRPRLTFTSPSPRPVYLRGAQVGTGTGWFSHQGPSCTWQVSAYGARGVGVREKGDPPVAVAGPHPHAAIKGLAGRQRGLTALTGDNTGPLTNGGVPVWRASACDGRADRAQTSKAYSARKRLGFPLMPCQVATMARPWLPGAPANRLPRARLLAGGQVTAAMREHMPSGMGIRPRCPVGRGGPHGRFQFPLARPGALNTTS